MAEALLAAFKEASSSSAASSTWEHVTKSVSYVSDWKTLISNVKAAIIQINSTIVHTEGARYGPPYPVILLSSSDTAICTAQYGKDLSNGQFEFAALQMKFRISDSNLMYYVSTKYKATSLSILYQ